MLINPVNSFLWTHASHDGQPALNFGTSTTSGTNTMGAWTEVVAPASVVHDVYGVYINLHSVGSSGSDRRALFDIGIDPAGGSAYTTLVPYLMAGQAGEYANIGNVKGGGVGYYFPIFIPAGSSVAARSSSSDGAGSCCVSLILFGQPTRPDAVAVGRWVEAIGITAASSEGTIVTPGTSSEGAWTALGTPSKSGWYAQVGISTADSLMGYATTTIDLSAGDGTNKRDIVTQHRYHNATFERPSSIGFPLCMGGVISTSDIVYGRAQVWGTINSGHTMAAYVLGG